MERLKNWFSHNWSILLAIIIFVVALCGAWGLFGLPDIWKNGFVVIISAAATYVIVAIVNGMQNKLQVEQKIAEDERQNKQLELQKELQDSQIKAQQKQVEQQAEFQSELLKAQSSASEEREKSIQMYQNKLDAFTEFSNTLWGDAAIADDIDYVKICNLLYGKIIFYLNASDIDELINIFENVSPNNKVKLYSELTILFQKSLERKEEKEKVFEVEKLEKLWRVIDINIPKYEKTTLTDQLNTEQKTEVTSFTDFGYEQPWHFAMWSDKQLENIGEGKINELSLVEYGESWRTNLLKQIRKDDVVFLFRRGGYGYIGAFRPKGWRIFEYGDNEKLYEIIHRFGEEEIMVKEEALVNADVEKYDIYRGIKDSADLCSNLIVEPIYYLGYEAGTNPGGVYRRTISRYDAGYATRLMKWFEENN